MLSVLRSRTLQRICTVPGQKLAFDYKEITKLASLCLQANRPAQVSAALHSAAKGTAITTSVVKDNLVIACGSTRLHVPLAVNSNSYTIRHFSTPATPQKNQASESKSSSQKPATGPAASASSQTPTTNPETTSTSNSTSTSTSNQDPEHHEITLRSLMTWGGVRKAYHAFGKPFVGIYALLWLAVLAASYAFIKGFDCGERVMEEISKIPYFGAWLKQLADAHPTYRDPVIAFVMADLTEIIRIPLAVVLTRRYVRMVRAKKMK